MRVTTGGGPIGARIFNCGEGTVAAIEGGAATFAGGACVGDICGLKGCMNTGCGVYTAADAANALESGSWSPLKTEGKQMIGNPRLV